MYSLVRGVEGFACCADTARSSSTLQFRACVHVTPTAGRLVEYVGSLLDYKHRKDIMILARPDSLDDQKGVSTVPRAPWSTVNCRMIDARISLYDQNSVFMEIFAYF
jgi:hypothetical protein